MEPEITNDILRGLAIVRKDGRTNMLDKSMVQIIANDLGQFDLVCFIADLDELPHHQRGKLYMEALNQMGERREELEAE